MLKYPGTRGILRHLRGCGVDSPNQKKRNHDSHFTLSVYQLESRWRNTQVLVYHGPLTNPPFGSCVIYFHHSVT